MKILHVGICSAVLVSLAGCSAMGLGSKRIDYRAAAVQVPSLEIPPPLSAPGADERYKVLGSEGESVATYSSYTKEEAAVSPRRANAVLPAVADVSLERSGTQRWLKVAEPAEKVWPVVTSFLQETGLKIQSEDQKAGIIVTEWAENRARMPEGGLRSVFGKVFDNMSSSGVQDQYRIRLERDKDGVSTEIYITQYGKKQVADTGTSDTKLLPGANDPELEAEMLQRLMVRFGENPAQAAAVTAGVSAAAGTASLLQLVDGSSVIVINDAFDKSWRRVGLAIERAGYAVEDKDREKGVYFLRTVKVEKGWMDKLEFWKSDEGSNLRYRVNVKDGGTSCEVAVVDQNGASSGAAKQRLEAIYKNINQ